MEFFDYWRLLRRNWLLLLLFAISGLLAGAAVSFVQPTVFSATSSAYVVAGTSATTGDALAGSSLAKDKVVAYLPLVKSQQVATRIASDLGLVSTAGVAASLSAEVTKDSVLLQITANAKSAEDARRLADAAVRATAAEVESLETINPSGSGRTTTVIKVVPVQQATAPAQQISPMWARNLAIGPALGLLLGFMVAVARRILDRRVRSSTDAQALAGVGTLGVIPKASELARGVVLAGDMGPAAEAMRLLRTNLRFVNVDEPPRSIVVTSANPGEGKSTIAAHLATMLAESGRPTVLVDADLRRPMVAKRFNVDGAVGLTQVLAGHIELTDALIAGPVPSLKLLTAGRIPPNPSELVGSGRMRSLIEALAADHMVILDAPPLLAVTDAGLLTGASDGALLVIKAGSTFKEQVELCRDTFDKVGGGLLGTVLNMVTPKDMGAAVYGYGYSSHRTGYYQYSSRPVADEHDEPSPSMPNRTRGRSEGP